MKYLILLIAVLSLTRWDCPKRHPVPAGPPPPLLGPVAETPQQKVDRLTGDLATAVSERDEARLAGVRTTILWAEGISALGLLACVGLAVASLALGLSFTWKIPAALGMGFVAILCSCLALTWALGHVVWIVGGLLALVALGVWWLSQHGWSLTKVARAAYDAAPDSLDLGTAETLLTRITPRIPTR